VLKTKICTKCKTDKDFSEFRKSKKGDKHGLHSWCYDCNRAARRKHYSDNRDRYSEWYKSWCAKNPDKVKAYEAARDRDYAKSYRKWISLPGRKEQKRAYGHNYRARVRLADGQITKEVIGLVLEIYGERCLKCGSEDNIQIDHVVPLAIGGDNLFGNLQPLCRSCNSSKGARSCEDYRPV
jgi:5-methylcytosine-specific restriction endonuclease McrA